MQSGDNVPKWLQGEQDEIVAALGAAVLKRWNDIPQPIQRLIFEAASAGHSNLAPDAFRKHIALLLHDYNERTSK